MAKFPNLPLIAKFNSVVPSTQISELNFSVNLSKGQSYRHR